LEEHKERLKRSDSSGLCSLRLRSDPYEGNKYKKAGAKFKKEQILETVWVYSIILNVHMFLTQLLLR
jgi:hypothetical protein